MADTIDPDFLRTKYREERDKRLRPDGNAQYLEPTGKFADFGEDPYVALVERAPIFDEHTVVLIGGGFSGLCTGARLKQAGIDDVCIIESGGDFGGAWYWNRYPGAMCDTAAIVYLPLLEETGHMPTRKYVMAPEIFEHCQLIAQTSICTTGALPDGSDRLEWDDRRSGWSRPTATIRSGPLRRHGHRAAQGQAARHTRYRDVQGHAFHTSRWDYKYTGGDWPEEPMDKLHDKNVAIIGTGATGVQCSCQLAEAAAPLRVPTHAVLGLGARPPPHRSRVVLVARARLAAEVAHELRNAARLRPHGRGPSPRRMDRPRAGTCRAECSRS